MNAVLVYVRLMDWISERFGRLSIWLVLVACLVSAGNAFSRYGFNLSSNAWLEVQWYMFAAMVMLGSPMTLKVNEHVRVDLVYGRLGTRGQVWVDIVGGFLFLLPAMALLAWSSIDIFQDSWRIGEMSPSAGGLIRWPAKLLLPVGFALITLQGVAEILKRIAYLRGAFNMDVNYARPLQ